jgi:aarF domain-containing kinase
MKRIARGIGAGANSLLRVAKTSGVATKYGMKWLLDRRAGNEPPTPQFLRRAFEDLGATYIKLGQFIASSPSVFPEAYILEFQKCLDKTEPLPYHLIHKELLKAFDRPLNTIFSRIEERPLASASIAQVHAARLVSGEDVVIKVRKPGVYQTITTDMTFIHVVMRLLEMVAPHLSMASIGDIAEDIRQSMIDECDFTKEAANMELWRAFLKRKGHDKRVVVPRVYPQASNTSVLCMERLYGEPVTSVQNVSKYTSQPHLLMREAMSTWFESLYDCEIFHADVHAGNLMVLKDGRVAFIDFGIVGRLAPGTWEALRDFGLALPAGDYDTMANAMQVVGITQHRVDTQALASDIKRFVGRVDALQDMDFSSPADVMDAELDKILIDFVKLGRKHGIQFPRQFGLLVKQLLYFDRFRHVFSVDVMLEDFLDMKMDNLGGRNGLGGFSFDI